MSVKYYNQLDSFEDWDDNYSSVMSLINKDADLVKKAIEIIEKYHNQNRYLYKGIYNRHPLRVARILLEEFNLNDINSILIALCHDLGEWSDYDIKNLKEEFNLEVYNGVKALTWDKNKDWRLFVEKIIKTNNQNLIQIKIADKLDNNRGLVFSDNSKEKLKAKKRTNLIIRPIIKKYYPEYWVKFKEAFDNF